MGSKRVAVSDSLCNEEEYAAKDNRERHLLEEVSAMFPIKILFDAPPITAYFAPARSHLVGQAVTTFLKNHELITCVNTTGNMQLEGVDAISVNQIEVYLAKTLSEARTQAIELIPCFGLVPQRLHRLLHGHWVYVLKRNNELTMLSLQDMASVFQVTGDFLVWAFIRSNCREDVVAPMIPPPLFEYYMAHINDLFLEEVENKMRSTLHNSTLTCRLPMIAVAPAPWFKDVEKTNFTAVNWLNGKIENKQAFLAVAALAIVLKQAEDRKTIKLNEVLVE
jgi:hypothetical protein